MKKNIWVAVFSIVLLAFLSLFIARAMQQSKEGTTKGTVIGPRGASAIQTGMACETITTNEFASILFDKLGLTMPEGSEVLSEAEAYELKANLLAERGINAFVNTTSNAQVTLNMLADVLYTAVDGPSPATEEEKTDYLANLGYITSSTAEGFACLTDVIGALAALSDAIIEAYSAPEILAEPPSPTEPGPPEGPPPIAPESPASPIGGHKISGPILFGPP